MIGIWLMMAGAGFSLIGALGFIRFKDIYIRSHAQTVVNVGGVCLILLGIMADSFLSLTFVKALFIIIFIFATSPAGTHAIAKAAYVSGSVRPTARKDEWKHREI